MGAKHNKQVNGRREEEKANRVFKNICIVLVVLAILFIAIAMVLSYSLRLLWSFKYMHDDFTAEDTE